MFLRYFWAVASAPLLWVPFWLASLSIVILTFTAYAVGVPIVSYVPDWIDAGLPMVGTVAEFLLFSFLTPSATPGNPTIPLFLYWYLCVAVISLILGPLFGCNLIVKVGRTQYDPFLRSLTVRFAERVKARIRDSMLIGGSLVVIWASLLIWAVLRPCPQLTLGAWQGIIGVLVTAAVLGVGLRGLERDRREIAGAIFGERKKLEAARRSLIGLVGNSPIV